MKMETRVRRLVQSGSNNKSVPYFAEGMWAHEWLNISRMDPLSKYVLKGWSISHSLAFAFGFCRVSLAIETREVGKPFLSMDSGQWTRCLINKNYA